MTRIAPAAPPPAFPDIKPFPGESQASAGIGHNRPPLEEQVVQDLESAIDETPGLRTRIRDLITKADTLPPCTDEETAGKLGDFIKMAKDAASRVDAIREQIKRPYLTATRNLDAKARTHTEALTRAGDKARVVLNGYVAEQDRKRREAEAAERERQRAEEEARRAAAVNDEPEPAFIAPEPAPERARSGPVATGDLGAKVGTRSVWRHDPVTDLKVVKALPKEILGNAKVLEAINTVIAAQVRAGTRSIKGVVIREHIESSIR